MMSIRRLLLASISMWIAYGSSLFFIGYLTSWVSLKEAPQRCQLQWATFQQLETLKKTIETYHAKLGTFPASLGEPLGEFLYQQYQEEEKTQRNPYPGYPKPSKEQFIKHRLGHLGHGYDPKRGILDEWGHPFQYEVTETSFRIWSLGRDGKPGGIGLDADIDGGNIADYHPTLEQFITNRDDREIRGSSPALWAIAGFGLAGFTFFITNLKLFDIILRRQTRRLVGCFITLRPQAPEVIAADEETLQNLHESIYGTPHSLWRENKFAAISLALTAVSGLIVWSILFTFFLSCLHIPNGH